MTPYFIPFIKNKKNNPKFVIGDIVRSGHITGKIIEILKNHFYDEFIYYIEDQHGTILGFVDSIK